MTATSPPWLVMAALLATSAVFIFDVLIELGVAAAVPYSLILWFFHAQPRTTWIWGFAVLATVLTLLGYVWSPDGGEPWKVWTNRALAILLIWGTASLCAQIVKLRGRFVEREQARLIATFDAAPLGLVMVDQTGSIVLANRALEVQFGYSRDELLGMSIEHLVPDPHRATHTAHRARAFAETLDPGPRNMSDREGLFGQRRDGTLFPIVVGLNPTHVERKLHMLAAVVDITKRYRVEQDLRKSNEALLRSNLDLKHFAYVASHDLQTHSGVSPTSHSSSRRSTRTCSTRRARTTSTASRAACSACEA